MKKVLSIATITMALTGCITVSMDLESVKVGKSNPASEYCLQQKGFLDFVTDKQGNTVGMCHLPNGQVVEEWQLYRANHQ